MAVKKGKFGILKVLLMVVINFLIHSKKKINILILFRVFKVNLEQGHNLFKINERKSKHITNF